MQCGSSENRAKPHQICLVGRSSRFPSKLSPKRVAYKLLWPSDEPDTARAAESTTASLRQIFAGWAGWYTILVLFCCLKTKMASNYSVIIPTHRRANLLERSLASVKAAAMGHSLEVVVISDTADEMTERVCRQWLDPSDIYVRRNGSSGPSESRNLGLSLATGQIVLFLDDDDAWHPQILNEIAKSPTVQCGHPIYFNCSVVKERRLETGPIWLSESELNTMGMLTRGVYVKNQVHMSCFAFPRVLVSDLRFDPHMRAYEDWDFLLSVFDRQMPTHENFVGSRVFEVDDESTDRRGSSADAQNFNAVLDYLYVYRRHQVDPDLQQARAQLLATVGLNIPAATV